MNLSQFDTKARVQLGRGSYMPVLMKLVGMTTGPIFELGTGYISTPYLHWACFTAERPLVSFEDNAEWYGFASRFSATFHQVRHVSDWDAEDLSGPCAVAFIDHCTPRRRLDIPRVAHADYVVIHDTENTEERKYHMWRPISQYRWRTKYTDVNGPATTVCSNRYDVTGLSV